MTRFYCLLSSFILFPFWLNLVVLRIISYGFLLDICFATLDIPRVSLSNTEEQDYWYGSHRGKGYYKKEIVLFSGQFVNDWDAQNHLVQHIENRRFNV